ncbi:MAG TPA: VWA domain-containing protein [Elusimicrobiales bacterium]|nr:VWA domain-containing protein [Elusimicrobiales bacterium]
MSFANPYFLLLLVPVIIAALLPLGRSSGARLSYPMPAGLEPEKTLYSTLSSALPFLLRIAALTLLVLALARPQKVSREALPPSEGVDIMICLDTSPSMGGLDFDPYTRLEAAKKTAQEFIAKRPNDRIGILVFGGVPLLQCPLTLDHASLLEYLDGIYINMTRRDGTAIGDAIAASVRHIKNSTAKSRVLLLLTDGRSNTGSISDPALAAKAAASYGIKIYAIGTAGKGPAKIIMQDPLTGLQQFGIMQDDLDESTLLEISRLTNGEFFRATNYVELQNIYTRIDALEKTEYTRRVDINYEDRYLYFLLPALILLLLEYLLCNALFVRLP